MSVRSLSRPRPGLTDGDINIAENRTIILLLLQTGLHEDLGKINIKDYVHNCVHCTFIIVVPILVRHEIFIILSNT